MMDDKRFDILSRAIGRRGALAIALGVALGASEVTAKNAHRVRKEAPKCRGVGHPCPGKGNVCCAGLECRVTGHGSVDRCAVPGEPEPPPVDPPNGGGGTGGGTGDEPVVPCGNAGKLPCVDGSCNGRRVLRKGLCRDRDGEHCQGKNECIPGRRCMYRHGANGKHGHKQCTKR